MKKILSAILILITLTGCKSIERNITPTDTVAGKTISPSVTSGENGKNIVITIPAVFYQDQNVQEAINEAKNQGKVEEGVVNSDGSVTYTMTREQYDRLLNDIKIEIDKSLNSLKDGETYPSIKDVSHSDDYSEFTFTVIRKDYENSLDAIASYTAAAGSMLYNIVKNNQLKNPTITINIKDNNTGEIFDTIKYPDDFTP